MNLFCLLRGHLLSGRLWNNGYYFARCERCHRELISRGRRWRRVPRGYRVVWKPRPPDYPRWDPVLHVDEPQDTRLTGLRFELVAAGDDDRSELRQAG